MPTFSSIRQKQSFKIFRAFEDIDIQKIMTGPDQSIIACLELDAKLALMSFNNDEEISPDRVYLQGSIIRSQYLSLKDYTRNST